MQQGTWAIYPALPEGLEFVGSMARSGQPGAIYGTPTETSPMTNYTCTQTTVKQVLNSPLH